MPSTILVARPDPPGTEPPPRGGLVAGALVLAGLGLLAFGWMGDSPAGEAESPDSAAIEAPLPVTAATTLPPGTTPTQPSRPEVPAAVEWVSVDELAGPGLSFQEVPPAEGLDVITHVVGVDDGIAAFGRPTVEGPRTGLYLGRWNGAWWTDPVEIVPVDEFAVHVAGGPPGFVVISARGGPLGLFPGGLAPSAYRMRVSSDGEAWEEAALPEGVYPTGVIVNAGGAWLLGFEQSEFDRMIADAMTGEMRRLHEAGDVFVIPLGSTEIGVHAPAIGTRVGSMELPGITAVEDQRRFVLFHSTDLSDWEQESVPRVGSFVSSAGVDATGSPFLVSPFGIWRKATGDEWHLAASFAAGMGGGPAVATQEAFLVASPFTAVAEIQTYDIDGAVTRVRFPLSEQQFGRTAAGTAGDGSSAMFATGAPLDLEDEPGYLELTEGRRLVIDLRALEYRVLGSGDEVIAVSSIVETAENRSFDPDAGTLTFYRVDSDEVAATVEIGELEAWGSTNLRYRPLGPGGLLYTLGDEWRYQPLADLLGPAASDTPAGISSVSALGSTFVVASGPIDPWVSNRAPSRIWIGSPPS